MRGRHRREIRTLLIGTFALLALAETAPAQRPPSGVTLSIGPVYLTDLQQQDVIATILEAEVEVRSELVRTLEAGPSVGFGIAVDRWLTPAWGVRLQAARVSAGVEAVLETGDEDQAGVPLFDDRDIPVPSERGDLAMTMLHAALLFRIPAGGELRPYGLVGAGLARHSLEADPVTGQGSGVPDATGTGFSALAGVGAWFPLWSGRLDGQVELSARISDTPAPPATEAVDRPPVVIVPGRTADPFVDGSLESVRSMGISLGVRYLLGARP